jgi:hypothetical protein
MSYKTGWWLPETKQQIRELFENEYIRRELKILIYSGSEERDSQLKRALTSRKAIILTDNSKLNFKELKDFPKKSIILFILSDETYSFKLNLFALANPAVDIVIRNYPKADLSRLVWIPKHFIKKIVRIGRFPSLFVYLPKAILSGVYIAVSQIFMEILSRVLRKKLLVIPQGYDSGFARIYAAHFELDREMSLFTFASKAPISNFLKEFDLCFLGQRGNLDRRLMLAELHSQLKNSRDECKFAINQNEDYQSGRGHQQQEIFFDLMRKSKYTLSPPGNYSVSTFRFFEALLTLTVPICDEFVFSDPLSDQKPIKSWPIEIKGSSLENWLSMEERRQQVQDEIGGIIKNISLAQLVLD